MTLTHLLVLLIVGALAGLIGERLVGRGMPGGLIGAIVAGLVGAWLMVDVLHVVLAPELSLGVWWRAARCSAGACAATNDRTRDIKTRASRRPGLSLGSVRGKPTQGNFGLAYLVCVAAQ